MHVSFNLIFFLRLVRKFGVYNGIKLFLNLKFNSGEKFKVPNLPHPIYLRPKTSDVDIFVHVFIFDEYAIKWDSELNFIIDAGANIGMFALYIKQFYPNAHILCVEPDEENYSQLKKNVELYSGIDVINKGLWNKECFLTISDKFNWGKWAMIIEENDTEGEIPCTTIDQLQVQFKQPKIDLLKIDIESSEREVFSENYSIWLSKTSNIVIELHDRLKSNCGLTFFKAITNTFSSFDYEINGENTIIKNCKID